MIHWSNANFKTVRVVRYENSTILIFKNRFFIEIWLFGRWGWFDWDQLEKNGFQKSIPQAFAKYKMDVHPSAKEIYSCQSALTRYPDSGSLWPNVRIARIDDKRLSAQPDNIWPCVLTPRRSDRHRDYRWWWPDPTNSRPLSAGSHRSSSRSFPKLACRQL